MAEINKTGFMYDSQVKGFDPSFWGVVSGTEPTAQNGMIAIIDSAIKSFVQMQDGRAFFIFSAKDVEDNNGEYTISMSNLASGFAFNFKAGVASVYLYSFDETVFQKVITNFTPGAEWRVLQFAWNKEGGFSINGSSKDDPLDVFIETGKVDPQTFSFPLSFSIQNKESDPLGLLAVGVIGSSNIIA